MMRSSLIIAGMAISAVTFAQAGVMVVPGTMNIHGAGLGAPPGSNPGILPGLINLDAGTGRTATFSATGAINPFGGAPYSGPDGDSGGATDILATGSISGFKSVRRVPLVGVFLDANAPAGPAPATLDYTLADLQLASYSPLMNQVFFIGNGWTDLDALSGTQQVFIVPDAATRLFIGTIDGFSFTGANGFYDDNVGEWDVNYQVVPEPATMLGIGAMSLLALRRRKSR